MTTSKKENTRTLVQMAFLSALVIVLQLIATATAGLLPVNLTLTLVPIVLGGILLGPAKGAFLGMVFGLITFFACMLNMDQGGAILFQANPAFCLMICIIKGTSAGWVSAVAFQGLRSYRNSAESAKDSQKRLYVSVALSAALAPIVNTVLFCLGMFFLYSDVLHSWAGGGNVLFYMLFGLAGWNFLIEFFCNLLIVPSLIRYLQHSRYFKNIK